MATNLFITKVRTLREIEIDMARVLQKEPKNQTEAQFIRDLERLLIVSRQSPAYERGE